MTSRQMFILGLACCAVAMAAAQTVPPTAGGPPRDPRDLLIADFEGSNYGPWKTSGTAFGTGPAPGTLPGQMVVDGFQGNPNDAGFGKRNPLQALEFVEKLPVSAAAVLILRDFHRFLDDISVSRKLRISSMPRFDAPSISSTTIERPSSISRATGSFKSKSGFGPPVAFKAFAKIRATEVLPTPRDPEKIKLCGMRPEDNAFLSVVSVACCPTTSSNDCGRYLRAKTR